jgi:hypothetical protein
LALRNAALELEVKRLLDEKNLHLNQGSYKKIITTHLDNVPVK